MFEWPDIIPRKGFSNCIIFGLQTCNHSKMPLEIQVVPCTGSEMLGVGQKQDDFRAYVPSETFCCQSASR